MAVDRDWKGEAERANAVAKATRERSDVLIRALERIHKGEQPAHKIAADVLFAVGLSEAEPADPNLAYVETYAPDELRALAARAVEFSWGLAGVGDLVAAAEKYEKVAQHPENRSKKETP